MKNLLILTALMLSVTDLLAQDNRLMNYNGHWYAPGDNSLDKEALRYQLLIKEKSQFDSMAKRKDVFVNRNQYNETINELDRLAADEVGVANSTETGALLKDYIYLVKSLRNNAQANDEYRRMLNTTSARILMSRREGWSNDLYWYVLRESIVSVLDFFNAKANTDNILKIVMNGINGDSRYTKCGRTVTVDSKMTDDPAMQVFVCDRMEYILGADIYRYRESTPGIVNNYEKRKKESGDLFGWLLQRCTQERAKFITMTDFNHSEKGNMASFILSANTNWYVFVFYKGLLYYSDALPKCGNDVTIPLKQ